MSQTKFGLFNSVNSAPIKTWDADYIKLVDKDKVEIYQFKPGSLGGQLVAVVSLDRGQDISEIVE